MGDVDGPALMNLSGRHLTALVIAALALVGCGQSAITGLAATAMPTPSKATDGGGGSWHTAGGDQFDDDDPSSAPGAMSADDATKAFKGSRDAFSAGVGNIAPTARRFVRYSNRGKADAASDQATREANTRRPVWLLTYEGLTTYRNGPAYAPGGGRITPTGPVTVTTWVLLDAHTGVFISAFTSNGDLQPGPAA